MDREDSDARLRALIDDYAERLSHFVRCEVTELRELGRTDKTGIDKETKRISDALRPGSLRCFWIQKGRSGRLRSWLHKSGVGKEVGSRKWRLSSVDLTGLQGLKARRRQALVVSRLTLTHEMARVLLFEQLYRAYTIVHGLPYQK